MRLAGTERHGIADDSRPDRPAPVPGHPDCTASACPRAFTNVPRSHLTRARSSILRIAGLRYCGSCGIVS